jgi:hypothetical protein
MSKKKAAAPKVEVIPVDALDTWVAPCDGVVTLSVAPVRTIEPVGNRFAIKCQGQITAYYNSFEAAIKDLA